MTILKCLFAENKPKKELIQVLIQRGYESDPVKAWKEAQNKVMPQSSSEYAQTGPKLWDFIILREAQVAFQFAGFKSFRVWSVALPLYVSGFLLTMFVSNPHVGWRGGGGGRQWQRISCSLWPRLQLPAEHAPVVSDQGEERWALQAEG